MESNPQNNSQDAASVGTVPQASEGFRTVPNVSEPFRTMRNDSESFRSVPHPSERKEIHTLTVREAARMFEDAGVARTERSIVNWCQQNAMGVARLDAYFDPNERKYFLTQESVERAIAEEKAKATKTPEPATPFGTILKEAERPTERRSPASETETERVRELEKEVMDLKITNRGKDFFIEQLKSGYEAFAVERQGYVETLMTFNRKVGELETKLLQLDAPKRNDQPKFGNTNQSSETHVEQTKLP